MIRAAIFDMDGLLIDSEPLWREAIKTIFNKVGLHLTDAMCAQTMGFRIDEVVRHWHQLHPWQNKSLKQVETEVLDEVERLIQQQAQPMEGVYDIISFFKQRNIKLAVASSSPFRIIASALKKFELSASFEVIHSAQFEEQGKPHPAVYLSAARMLQVEPGHCIAFEDSVNGFLSAKAASMKTVVVPDSMAWNRSQFNLADLKLPSLATFNETHFAHLNIQ